MIHTKDVENKMHSWQEMQAKVLQMQDRLGKGVDAGIVETVIVFNLLGISTVMSCEGHLQGASYSPWVDIEDETASEQMEQVAGMFKEARAAYAQGVNYEHLFEEAHQARRIAMKRQLILRHMLMHYLMAFYAHRQVPYDVQLIIQAHAGGGSRLESQGAGLQEMLEEQERADNLRRYQEEMQAFTRFLKQQYFLEGQGYGANEKRYQEAWTS